MAKVEVTRAEPTYTITLSEDEASALMALTGNTVCHGPLQDLHDRLVDVKAPRHYSALHGGTALIYGIELRKKS